MLIMTSERCPQCGQIIYMKPHPKKDDNDNILIHDGHAVAGNCYLDIQGSMTIAMMDYDVPTPSYVCIHCGWFVE